MFPIFCYRNGAVQARLRPEGDEGLPDFPYWSESEELGGLAGEHPRKPPSLLDEAAAPETTGDTHGSGSPI